MAARLMLLCHGATASMRVGGFPAAEEALDSAGHRRIPSAGVDAFAWSTSPRRAAQETAKVLSVSAEPEDRLRDMDWGLWSGRNFAELMGKETAAFERWLSEPSAGVPGGESFTNVKDRIAPWLAEQAASGARRAAITHPMVVRAALACALDLTTISALRFDIAPLIAATLSFNGVWRLQGLQPLGSRGRNPHHHRHDRLRS